MSAWSELLDQMECRLTDAEMVIRAKRAVVEPFSMPEGLGPIPPECRERARRVLAATDAMEHRVIAVMERVRVDLAGHTMGRPAASFVDRRL